MKALFPGVPAISSFRPENMNALFWGKYCRGQKGGQRISCYWSPVLHLFFYLSFFFGGGPEKVLEPSSSFLLFFFGSWYLPLVPSEDVRGYSRSRLSLCLAQGEEPLPLLEPEDDTQEGLSEPWVSSN